MEISERGGPFYHGGICGLRCGDTLLPGGLTGNGNRQDIALTRDLNDARGYAARWPGGGTVYAVAVERPTEPDVALAWAQLHARSAVVARIVERWVPPAGMPKCDIDNAEPRPLHGVTREDFQRWYHGGPAGFEIGFTLLPGERTGRGKRTKFVWAARSFWQARAYALARSPRGSVYEVEPIAPELCKLDGLPSQPGPAVAAVILDVPEPHVVDLRAPVPAHVLDPRLPRPKEERSHAQ